MNQRKIGMFIAALRKEKGYTQREIADKLGLSEKTISKWECGNGLPEIVYMEPLCTIMEITVDELLAGERISVAALLKTLAKTRAELVKQLELEQLKMRIYKLYGIEIESMLPSENGAGSLTYLVQAGNDKYVVKYPSDNSINHPELEPELCWRLLEKGLPVCDFVINNAGRTVSIDENGRSFTMQRYYEGVTYDYFKAPVKLQKQSAQMLARIHTVMRDMEPLSEGIGESFIKYRKPKQMLNCYESTLRLALANNDIENVNEIQSNMGIIAKLPTYSFSLNKLSVGNTHGDYMISQIIWKDERINGVIDWTTACRHPYIWEIMRSYLFMAPESEHGEINIDAIIDYFKAYQEINPLNEYDLAEAGEFFYYFLSVCDFYGQYYSSITKNREIYLKQAKMASGLLRWFDAHLAELTRRLCEL